MNRSRRSNRFGLGRGLRSLLGKRRSPQQLATAAGAAEQAFEALEQRQLLFTLTVDPSSVNPLTGLGTVAANFSYFIPQYLRTADPQQPQTTTETEDVDQLPLGNVVTGSVFPQNNLRIEHNVNFATVVNVFEQDNEIQVSMGPGQFIRLIRLLDGQQNQTQVGAAVQMSFDVSGGLNVNDLTITVRNSFGDVINTYTGQQITDQGAAIGGGVVRYTFTPPQGEAIGSIEIASAANAPSDLFNLDNISMVVTTHFDAQNLGNRLFGGIVVFAGPAGATIQFFDVNGLDMRANEFLGEVNGVVIGDPDRDGTPVNDGIGRIVITGTNEFSTMTLFGGTYTLDQGFQIVENPIGLYDEMEQTGGMGFAATNTAPPRATGMPAGSGSVIVGSPWIGNSPGGTITTGFTRANQGIFVNGGAPIGSVYVHGMVFGSSQFSSTVGKLIIGNPMGSFSVQGDLGQFVSSADAGIWVRDDTNASVATGGQLTVGRTLREVTVGGRMLLTTTVLGDLSRPSIFQPQEIYKYYESEWSPNIGTQPQPVATINGILNNSQYLARNFVFTFDNLFFGRTSQQIVFGDTYLRNDSIMGAEWIGSAATAVQINGELGSNDPVMTREDPTDVYAFAADGSQDVTVELGGTLFNNALGVYARIVDVDGRTVAAVQVFDNDPRRVNTLRYRPTTPGVYYLVLATNGTAAGVVQNANYVVTVSGMAASTLGAFRTAGGFGNPATGLTPGLNVLSGSVGSLRIGTGYLTGAGAEATPDVVFNLSNGDNADSSMSWRRSSVSIPGHLYNITTGSDVEGGDAAPIILNVTGNLGNVVTGQSLALGATVNNGDFRNIRMTIGGSVAMLDIRGGLGVDQDPVGLPKPVDLPNSVFIRTGVDPLKRGDVGMIRVGWHAGGGTLQLQTPNGSVVGGLLISQDVPLDDGAPNNGIYGGVSGNTGLNLQLGVNSDLRFFDTPRIWQQNIPGVTTTLLSGAAVSFGDDAGGTVQIVLEGGDGTATGTVKVIPVSGSLGVAVGRIEVNLAGGANLRITSNGTLNSSQVISIGRIIVTGGDALSGVIIDGNIQVDVWRIEQTNGTLSQIQNTTPRGDIVAADVGGLTTMIIGTGDLGRTQVPAWGPQLIGPFLGIGGQGGGGQGGAGGPINLPQNAITGFWNGNLFRPVNNGVATVPPSSWLDDVGSPIDPYLNGLIVRAGDITLVQAGGAIGDVIADAGNIIQVRANADNITPQGRFDGIVGNIFGTRIRSVDVGDGLAQRSGGPLADTGITALDDINEITTTRPGANLSSIIAASNTTIGNANGDFPFDGIASINLPMGGSIRDAWIMAMTLDNFWSSFWADDGQYRGVIDRITTMGGNLFRSDVIAAQINTITLTNGYYDASRTQSAGNTLRIEAFGFRNSTINGGDQEFQISQILVAGNLGIITTTGMTGDISDLTVDVLGRTTEISANNINRSSFDSDISIDQIRVMGSLRGSAITAGRLTDADIKKSIASSRISVAGVLATLKAGDGITNTSITVSGPDGTLGKITARTIFTGTVVSAGPIDTIEVTEGDLRINITTTANQRGVPGNIKLLKAARDLDLRTDISGTVDEFEAGRHFGNISNPSVVLVRGDVKKLDIPNGALYSDLRVGQNLEEVFIGAVSNLPGASILGRGSIIAFGRIEEVTIFGDFAGTIESASGGIGFVIINNGSLLSTATIRALDGTINNILINNGNLYGRVHADHNILSIRLNGGADGVFGDLGINPAHSPGVAYDAFRNQLPPGTTATSAVQGPTITAGFNIGRIILTNGSIFETFIWAGRAIGTIDVTGDITRDSLTTGQANVIAAGSSIFLVRTSGGMVGVDILAGVKSFGDDNAPGGVGANADTIRSGRITTIEGGGAGTNVHVSAGMDAGADGLYNTFDERVVPGISYVRSVTFGGAVSDVSVFADSPTLTVTPGVVRAGNTFPNQDTELSTGAPVPGGQITPDVAFNFTWGGVSGTILFSGPGTAYWDSAAGRLSLVNTRLNSNVTVTAAGTLTNFRLVTNDDASMGQIVVNAGLAGNSIVAVDAYVVGITVGDVSDNTSIRAGMNLRKLTAANVSGGFIRGHYWVKEVVVGSFGAPGVFDEARIDLLAGDSVTVNGANSGLVNVERDLASFKGGVMNRAQFRTGASLGKLDAVSMFQTRVSIGDNLGPVDIGGDATETTIMAGGDLGEDVAPGGTGFNADRATAGSIGTVDIGGNFGRSSIVAGMLRGDDGFFGTADDKVAPGRSHVGDVVIGGTQAGSNTFTEQYRISSTGTLGAVTLGGAAPQPGGNFRAEALATEPTPIRVLDLQTDTVSNDWIATFFFNQVMDMNTFGASLTISELRNDGLTQIALVEGTDYFIGEFDLINNSVAVTFSRAVTDRNLIPTGGAPLPGASTPGTQDPSLAGPGVFRFELNAATLRARVANARLDGDSDGFAATNENYSQDEVVGDAGDKFSPEVTNIGDGSPDQLIDMYGPADLDLVMDNNLTPDGLPDVNIVRTIRGSVGDHPDNDINNFRTAGDADIYKITLQAGQILRLGAFSGTALLAGRFLYNSSFVLQGGFTADTLTLPVDPLSFLDQSQPEDYLIKTTGTYYIVVANSFDFETAGVVPNVPPGAGDTGKYAFTIQIFDDGDSGFAANSNAGNGAPVVNAPAAIVFAGPNGVFQNPGDPNYDDLASVTVGDYRFTLDAGPDGIRGTTDDIVSGSNGSGITSTRVGDALTSTINSAIGTPGHSGVPGDISADVDIFHLNNGQTIAPGTLLTVTVKLADVGADLGGFSQLTNTDFRGSVQFGLFDTTDAVGADDGKLIFSPTDFTPRAGEVGEVARVGQSAYGYNADGDFYISFVVPSHQGGTLNQAPKLALYLQGVFNTDYTIQVQQTVGLPALAVPQFKQNVFIETRGGTIDWLEAGGGTTSLSAYTTSVLGFTGNIAGQPVDQYVLSQAVARVQSIFSATGYNIVLSSNPTAFEFQDFSKVFLTASNDPITIFNRDNFGYSEHSDPYNLDRNDEAVLFIPSFSSLGFTPSQADVDAFVSSLSAAIGRRVGELMGLRITDDSDFFANPVDIMSANSVRNIPFGGSVYAFQDDDRALSTQFDSIVDTNFFLGRQNAFQLLDKFLTP
jgi:hypothetical protein